MDRLHHKELIDFDTHLYIISKYIIRSIYLEKPKHLIIETDVVVKTLAKT